MVSVFLGLLLYFKYAFNFYDFKLANTEVLWWKAVILGPVFEELTCRLWHDFKTRNLILSTGLIGGYLLFIGLNWALVGLLCLLTCIFLGRQLDQVPINRNIVIHLSTLLFVLAHYRVGLESDLTTWYEQTYYYLQLLPVGLFLAYLRNVKGIGACILLHMLNNGLSMLF
ncbi:type II CAAX prenyl endopeptidase Rce1 family protein [Persicobacter psychrovividus]|uniref:CPBP family glutamic-type intramembrane protease n=1 Tax=Persicobacter psychrovividus TaxID=387638 RepID=UPI0030CA18D0